MTDKQNCHAVILIQVPQQFKDLFLDQNIQRRRDLIADKQLWLCDHGCRDGGPLEHAARKLVRIPAVQLLRISQACESHGLDGPLPPLHFRYTTDCQSLLHLPADPAERVEGRHRVLEHHAYILSPDPAQVLLTAGKHLPSIKQNAALLVRLPARHQTADTHCRHRLPASTLSDNAQRLPPLQGK